MGSTSTSCAALGASGLAFALAVSALALMGWLSIGPVKAAVTQPSRCTQAGVSVQVLDPEGSARGEERESPAYLVWVDGHARFLVDAPPGLLARYRATGADPEDLEAVLLTHLRVEHAGGLVELLGSVRFGGREEPLPIFGPTGEGAYPSISDFLTSMFGRSGAYAYLGAFLHEGSPFILVPTNVSTQSRDPILIFSSDTARVRAIGIPHGDVPALTYELRTSGGRVAILGDQPRRIDDDGRFIVMARGADALVVHLALPPRTPRNVATAYSAPRRLAALAEATAARRVIASVPPGAGSRELAALEVMDDRFGGDVVMAADLACVPVQ